MQFALLPIPCPCLRCVSCCDNAMQCIHDVVYHPDLSLKEISIQQVPRNERKEWLLKSHVDIHTRQSPFSPPQQAPQPSNSNACPLGPSQRSHFSPRCV